MSERKRSQIDLNYKAFLKFMEKFPNVLVAQRNKFALMHNKKVVEFFDTPRDAYICGCLLYGGNENFSIQKVTNIPVDLGFFSHVVFGSTRRRKRRWGEMMKKGKKTKKRPVAHKVAGALLREDPRRHLETLACLYREGTVMPAEDIPDLIDAFEGAYSEIKREALDLTYSSPVEQALCALREQAKEAKSQEKRGK